jgi:hypothetical protein
LDCLGRTLPDESLTLILSLCERERRIMKQRLFIAL